MKKRVGVGVMGIVQKGNKFLVTKRVDLEDLELNSFWQFPGGGMEYGETAEETLHREIFEEVGIKVKIKKLIPKIFTIPNLRFHLVLIFFLCQMQNSKDKVILNEEASEYRFLTMKEISLLPTLPSTNEVLKFV